MTRGRYIALAAFVALLLVGAYCWLRIFSDSSAPVSVSDAVAGFREHAPGLPREDAPGLPRFGVYTYATRGAERLDATLDASHEYGGSSTITIEPRGCGLSERWQVLTTRWSEVLSCPATARRRLASTEEHHEFFGTGSDASYECEGDRLPRLAGLRAGTGWSTSCSGPSGSLALSSRVIGTEVWNGERAMDAVRIRSFTLVSGENDGRSTQVDVRRRSDGLLLERKVRTSVGIGALGGGRYEEAYSVRLISTRPRL